MALTADALRSLERMLDDLPKFCKQHEKQAMSEPGAFVGPKGVWVRFDGPSPFVAPRTELTEVTEWIPDGLPTQTKLHLRAEMLKPPTATDSKQRGYIYVHEMAPSRASSTTYIKLGRALRPVDRLSQWTSQCPSRTPIVRGFFPQSSDEGYLRGAQSVADIGGPFHMRWERLCLLELAGWEAVEGADDDDFAGGVRRRRGKQCADCGKLHVELFAFPTGAFERRVRDVVLRWQRWCGQVLV